MNNNLKNILVLLISALLLFIFWQLGLKWEYAKFLKSLTNVFLGVLSSFQSMLDPKADDPALCLYQILPSGKKIGTYCMELKLYSLGSMIPSADP